MKVVCSLQIYNRISPRADMQEPCSAACLLSLPQESGLSVWIGGRLHPLEGVPPPVAVILITIVIALFTEFASNTATIIIFLPVLAELVSSPVLRAALCRQVCGAGAGAGTVQFSCSWSRAAGTLKSLEAMKQVPVA